MMKPGDHVLRRPDLYIGRVQPLTEKMWVYEANTQQIVHKTIKYSPGLFKIFDEILVNAVDNKKNVEPENLLQMNTISVNFDKDKNEIKVRNNGKGISIIYQLNIITNKEMLVPTMVFGEMLTSSNYDDDQAKTVGGRNGVGAKACNVFSKKFTVETACKQDKQHYSQC